MKNLFFIIIMVTTSFVGRSQNQALENAINEGLTLLDSAKTMADMQAAVSKFQRIAMVEPSRWEPLYYLAYAQTNMSFWERDGDTKDKILDQAETNLNKSIELNGDKSELLALQGFIYQGRIQVSPMRGMTYSQKAAEVLEKALEENPENPRAQFLLAQNIYFTPKMFGGGAKNALPEFLKAKEKFDKENGKTGITPKWGARSNQRMIETCNKNS